MKHIPGSEFEFATVETIDARINHLEWLLCRGQYLTRGMPYMGPGRAELAVELEMLKFQWRGNALIRERGSL
jgi:hypothetical protein